MTRIVKVRTEDCISCGLCVSVLPQVFRFENGKSFAYAPEAAPEQNIQGCINACPVEAIYWAEK